jgi:hypothetical protein
MFGSSAKVDRGKLFRYSHVRNIRATDTGGGTGWLKWVPIWAFLFPQAERWRPIVAAHPRRGRARRPAGE